MLSAGMSTRLVVLELNVHFSTISPLQKRFREFGSTSNQPHKRRPRVPRAAQDLPIQHVLHGGLFVIRVRCCEMSVLWMEWPTVVVGLWYRQAYVMDNRHVDGILNGQTNRDEILRL